jgi:hypothetical protein
MALRSKVVFLQALNPAGCLPLKVLETHGPGWHGVAGAQVELLSIKVLLEML